MNELATYTWNKQIASYEVDCEGRLRASMILRLMQESGDLHTAQEGIPYEKVLEQGCMVLISRSSVLVHRYPRMRDQVKITTLHHGIHGVRMYRDFIFSIDGEPVIESTNEYFCADLQTRRVIRPDIFLNSAFATGQDYTPGNPKPQKIHLPGELEPAGERSVTFPQLDYNGHMNNANYCDFAVDALPEEFARRPARELMFNFIREALPGNTMRLFFAAEGEQAAVVLGEHDGQHSFAARFAYGPAQEQA